MSAASAAQSRELPYRTTLCTPAGDVLLYVWAMWVTWGGNYSDREQIAFNYIAPAEVLVALGVATPEMTVPGRPGKRLRDPHGDSFARSKGKGWVRILVSKPLKRAIDMPGFEPWMVQAARARWAQCLRRDCAYEHTMFGDEPGQAGHLRLVVDNTQ